jgi:hypothetical protein
MHINKAAKFVQGRRECAAMNAGETYTVTYYKGKGMVVFHNMLIP